MSFTSFRFYAKMIRDIENIVIQGIIELVLNPSRYDNMTVPILVNKLRIFF